MAYQVSWLQAIPASQPASQTTTCASAFPRPACFLLQRHILFAFSGNDLLSLARFVRTLVYHLCLEGEIVPLNYDFIFHLSVNFFCVLLTQAKLKLKLPHCTPRRRLEREEV
jgi:hypothetical protein